MAESTITSLRRPLIIILPAEKTYTLDEVKVGHYLLWDYIAKKSHPIIGDPKTIFFEKETLS